MITLQDYYMGRDLEFPSLLTPQLKANAQITVDRANALLSAFGQQRSVNSGWRPPAVNASTSGAAANSKHMTCQAIDLHDPDGDLDDWLYYTTQRLIDLKLWMEHPACTKGWCHVQIIPPGSGKLAFYP